MTSLLSLLIRFPDSDEQKALLSDPDVYLAYRKAVDDAFYRRYPYVINGSKISREVKNNTVNYMKDKLSSKPDILESILPEDFDIGCRRQTFAYGYMEALTDPKTTVSRSRHNASPKKASSTLTAKSMNSTWSSRPQDMTSLISLATPR